MVRTTMLCPTGQGHPIPLNIDSVGNANIQYHTAPDKNVRGKEE